ncbi:endonuclease [Brachybacterium sp. JHP9]|uniref:Endonuclease n=1 Tax=Brachybacterium equifaecis TaxID=2910770 RepID=A0ABT0QWV5_9MICO|nr:endonuclease [Brachybacterium equifaecis]MCL6422157.1 endonuclease [Brachybacterium equifaecis]
MTTSDDPRDLAARLVREHGTTFAADAGIALRDEPSALWELLLLTLLLSARIRSQAAVDTARVLIGAGWTSPERLAASTHRQRVAVLGRGGYRRYDESTSAKLAHAASLLQDRWGGDLRALRDEAGGDPARIARLLQEFEGIGPTGARIFLREVQAVWPSVRPAADDLVRKGARAAGLPTDPSALADLVTGDELAPLCAAMVRVARDPQLLERAGI